MKLRLTALSGCFCVVRHDKDSAMPRWFSLTGPLASACRTADELSLLSPEQDVPADVPGARGLRAFKVAGPLDFAQTGIIAAVAVPLAEADIPIFTVSTYETDYVLVPAARFEEAAQILSARFDVSV